MFSSFSFSECKGIAVINNKTHNGAGVARKDIEEYKRTNGEIVKSLKKTKKKRKEKLKKLSNNELSTHFKAQSESFLTSFEWRKLRFEALLKHGRRCQCCGATPATGAVMNVDHIKPRKLFPKLALDLNNLQVLCGECNHGKGNWNQTDFR